MAGLALIFALLLLAGCGGAPYETQMVSVGHEPPICDVASARSRYRTTDEITCRFEDAPQIPGIRVGIAYYASGSGHTVADNATRSTRENLRGIVTLPPAPRPAQYVCRVWQVDPPYEPTVWWKRLCESEPFTVEEP